MPYPQPQLQASSVPAITSPQHDLSALQAQIDAIDQLSLSQSGRILSQGSATAFDGRVPEVLNFPASDDYRVAIKDAQLAVRDGATGDFNYLRRLRDEMEPTITTAPKTIKASLQGNVYPVSVEFLEDGEFIDLQLDTDVPEDGAYLEVYGVVGVNEIGAPRQARPVNITLNGMKVLGSDNITMVRVIQLGSVFLEWSERLQAYKYTESLTGTVGTDLTDGAPVVTALTPLILVADGDPDYGPITGLVSGGVGPFTCVFTITLIDQGSRTITVTGSDKNAAPTSVVDSAGLVTAVSGTLGNFTILDKIASDISGDIIVTLDVTDSTNATAQATAA